MICVLLLYVISCDLEMFVFYHLNENSVCVICVLFTMCIVWVLDDKDLSDAGALKVSSGTYCNMCFDL